MFSGITSKLLLGSAIVIALMAGAFYWYYKDSQDTIATLNQNQATLQGAYNEQKKTINSLQEFMARQAAAQQELQRKLADAEKAKTDLEQSFKNHDLNKIGSEKGKLLEKILNEGSKKALREIENETARTN